MKSDVGVVSKVLRSDLGDMLLGKLVLIQMVCTIECLIAWLALKGLVGKDSGTKSSVEDVRECSLDGDKPPSCSWDD